MASISLILPPGWTLHPGGPHIALPLLKGYLLDQGIETHLHDLNIGSVRHYGIEVSESKILGASLTVGVMNNLYFDAEDKLQLIANQYDGTWFAHEGFRRNNCDIASPEDIRIHSQNPSPFTNYLKNEAIPSILSKDPKIIGITLIVPTQLLQAFELARLLRSAGYKGCIILGGNMITRLYNDMALNWVFDIIDGIVTLQGERTLAELYRCLEQKINWSTVPNLMWRDQGQIVQNLSSPLKVKEFAQPNYSGMPINNYWGTNYLTMIASRGCYYGKCSFCAIPFGYGKDGFIGNSPAQKVIGSMKQSSEKFGISRYKFVDEALHPKMMRDMAEIIDAEGLEFDFEAYLRLETSWTKPTVLKNSARAGLKKVYLGLELVPSDERDLLEKSDGADPLTLLKAMKDAGIKTHVFCMFGFPGTGVKEAFNTVEFALKHHDLIDTLDIFPFYYARHTKVEGVTIADESHTNWRVEHKYKPENSSTMEPTEVNILAEQLGKVVWSEQPQWFHPVYRMYSPWH